MIFSPPPTKKYQSPEYQAKVGIHSLDPKERSRAYRAGEDRTGTLLLTHNYKAKK